MSEGVFRGISRFVCWFFCISWAFSYSVAGRGAMLLSPVIAIRFRRFLVCGLACDNGIDSGQWAYCTGPPDSVRLLAGLLAAQHGTGVTALMTLRGHSRFVTGERLSAPKSVVLANSRFREIAPKWLGEGAKGLLGQGSKSLKKGSCTTKTLFCTGATQHFTGANGIWPVHQNGAILRGCGGDFF